MNRICIKKNVWSIALAGLCGLAFVASCSEKDDPYVSPEKEAEKALTRELADSLWQSFNTASPFVDGTDAVPTDINADYYEDYAETWLADEETRDVTLIFDGDNVTVNYDPDTKSKDMKFVHITCQGAHVIIRNDSVKNDVAEGRARMNYILKGRSDDGSVRIYSNKKFMLTLDGLSLTNTRGAAISVQKSFDKKRVFLNVLKGTENALCDAENYTDTVAGEDDKGCLFSEGKLILMGEGKLSVTGNYAHAIAADDRIHIHRGVQLYVLGAPKDGIHVKDELVQSGGYVEVFATKDAVQCDSVSDGYVLRGGRMMACAKRALTARPFVYNGGSFCLVGNDCSLPTDSLSTATNWSSAEVSKGIFVVQSTK
ncbi:MAG: carbohydrate-binding domain-containing protein [Bacteroidales bacterium]|nr:carbohydrate-binding domain-containing protein [Bacteroidales bacterium]